jgi:hypothetical protein
VKRSLSLTPLRKAPPLLFDYDEMTGALTGRDASLAADIIAAADRTRLVAIEPHPQSHLLGPTPHSLADIAAIFGQWYVLPDWLESARPLGDTGDDDAQVIY